METKLIYVPVNVKDRMPIKRGFYYHIQGEYGNDFRLYHLKKDGKWYEDHNDTKPTPYKVKWWLEEKEAYVFTEEELTELLEKQKQICANSATTKQEWDYDMYVTRLDRQSILTCKNACDE